MSTAKALAASIVAGVSAFGSAFALAWQDQVIDAGEGVAIGVAVITSAAAAYGIVWRVPNSPE